MSRLQEARDVMHKMKQAWERNQKTTILMITEVRGSAYRQPGAKMMMAADGQMFGTLSGGCLESDLFEWSKEAIRQSTPLTKQYDLSENELWTLGIGCKGSLEILIVPVDQDDRFWQTAMTVIQEERPTTLILEIPTGVRVLLDENGNGWGDLAQLPNEVRQQALDRTFQRTRAEVMTHGNRRFVIDTMRPSERLIIAGAGHDAVPLVSVAAQVGFGVTVLDPRKDFNNPFRFPSASHLVVEPSAADPAALRDSWWIIMNHQQSRDEASLALALKSSPRFIGVLGPLSRTQEMLANIGADLSSGPLHAPIGLDLGAESIEEVAISIISELMMVRSGSSGLPLHGRTKIHG
ncbi:XdhC family protein [Brevibacillus sp. SYP-B805]|uniref:XdhC family protein n=1 Tax=Brevibacillus sp. SYP-B805 TaxID=1578199 RepID=UPI0013ED8FFD|nr:XdhC/CoxI family protein [Brevibacillus sp. SYP-B805]NGQ95820.1 XdhC family protein [Brevibacillus sp. SYP-B805]